MLEVRAPPAPQTCHRRVLESGVVRGLDDVLKVPASGAAKKTRRRMNFLAPLLPPDFCRDAWETRRHQTSGGGQVAPSAYAAGLPAPSPAPPLHGQP